MFTENNEECRIMVETLCVSLIGVGCFEYRKNKC